MSGSTVSITANQVTNSRRRVGEKNYPTGGSDLVPASVGDGDAAKFAFGDKGASILRDARKAPAQTPVRKCNPARKSSKPRWLTVVSILTKNVALLVFILGLIQMVRWVVLNSGRDAEDLSLISGDFEGKFAEVEKFVKTTMKAMQVQVGAIDRKFEDEISLVRKEFEDEISLVRKEFDEKMEKNGEEVALKLKSLDVRSDVFYKFIDGFRTKSLLSKEEFGEFFEEFKKTKISGARDVSLDEIRDYAREIVDKEIEKLKADGLGKVDYALAKGGGRVVKHSEAYGVAKSFWKGVAVDSEKMLSPSFGEPGHCFPLKGVSGYAVIRLRTAIVPEAVTLEHVAKSVAYDRSSAPKHCRVFGWLQGEDLSDVEIHTKMFLLTEFTYDLEKSNAQTFKVLDSAASMVVDTVRFEFESNHGSASHTCIYRLRVHGHELNSGPALEM